MKNLFAVRVSAACFPAASRDAIAGPCVQAGAQAALTQSISSAGTSGISSAVGCALRQCRLRGMVQTVLRCVHCHHTHASTALDQWSVRVVPETQYREHGQAPTIYAPSFAFLLSTPTATRPRTRGASRVALGCELHCVDWLLHRCSGHECRHQTRAALEPSQTSIVLARGVLRSMQTVVVDATDATIRAVSVSVPTAPSEPRGGELRRHHTGLSLPWHVQREIL